MGLDVALDERNRQEYEANDNARRQKEHELEYAHYKDGAEKKIVELEKILQLLVLAGHVTDNQIKSARALVGS